MKTSRMVTQLIMGVKVTELLRGVSFIILFLKVVIEYGWAIF